MTLLADFLQNGANALHSVGINTPEMGLTEKAGGASTTASYLLPDTGATYLSTTGPVRGEQQVGNKIYDFSGQNVRYIRDVPQAGSDQTSQAGTSLSAVGLDGGYATSAATTAQRASDERSYYDDQINALNQLLGVTSSQRDAGLSNLQRSATAAQQRLAAQKAKAMQGYDTQSVENSQDKQRGVEEVDQFARNSYNSLQRLLQSGNSANSSVGRTLVPQLVSKAAGTRRTGVFDTAGRNERDIVNARGDAEVQYGLSEEDLRNQQGQQEQSFRQGILTEENRILNERRSAEIARAQASGAGYQQARTAAEGTQAGINDRSAQLAALFSQFNPTFNAKAVNLQNPELSQFTVDPAQIRSQGQGLPTESSYYLNQLKKKQDGIV